MKEKTVNYYVILLFIDIIAYFIGVLMEKGKRNQNVEIMPENLNLVLRNGSADLDFRIAWTRDLSLRNEFQNAPSAPNAQFALLATETTFAQPFTVLLSQRLLLHMLSNNRTHTSTPTPCSMHEFSHTFPQYFLNAWATKLSPEL
jgi:hypothetical protein